MFFIWAGDGDSFGLRSGDNRVLSLVIVRGVVVTGGEAPPASVVKEVTAGADMVVAADSGADTAFECGVKPDLVVGDFDSIRDKSILTWLGEARVQRHAAAKDFTDTELALQALRDSGCDELIIVGGGGGRMDHLIGILTLFDRELAPARWVTDRSDLVCVTTSVRISGKQGDVVSFFPLGCEPCSAVSSGLRWPLDGIEWRRGDAGVSNELTGDVAEVRVARGRLLMVRELEGGSRGDDEKHAVYDLS